MRRLVIFPLVLLAACQPAAPDPRGVARDETLLTVAATAAPTPAPTRRGCS